MKIEIHPTGSVPVNRNEKIINWIIKRAEEDYADDVDMVLAYGSFINGTAHEKSDVDCYFIPRTERGYGFGTDFILEGVGYDIFPMSWERVANIADMNEVLLPCVGGVRILYARTEEEEKRFAGLQERLASHLRDASYTGKKRKNSLLLPVAYMSRCFPPTAWQMCASVRAISSWRWRMRRPITIRTITISG